MMRVAFAALAAIGACRWDFDRVPALPAGDAPLGGDTVVGFDGVDNGPIRVVGEETIATLDDGSGDDFASCTISGGRDLFFELDVPASQSLYVDTFGSEVPLSVTFFSSPCDDLPTTSSPCFSGPCPEGAQIIVNVSPGPICVIVDELTPGTAPATVVLHTILTGTEGLLPVGPGGGLAYTCAYPNAWSSTACGPVPASEASYFITLCPSDRVTVQTNVVECDPPNRDLVIALRSGSASTSTELACATGTCQTLPLTLGPFPLDGPGLFWASVDGPDPAQCGFARTEVIVTPR